MTKTIDEQLERLASAQERSATALEGILEAVTSFKFEQAGSAAVTGASVSASVSASTLEDDNAGTDDQTATKEAPIEEAEEVAEETPESEPEPAEAPGDGDAYVLPEKMTNDTLRGLARDLMEKEGKPAVFEVLAEIGSGYKAVGEVLKDDLQEGHEKMIERLRG